MRLDGRSANQIRPLTFETDYLPHAEGSVRIQMGKTIVLCAATMEPGVPQHLKGSGTGWVTAEYALMPRSTLQRTKRERGKTSGRTQEIQRLIGRSLRSVVNLGGLGENTFLVDCDVLCADGGTRTASISGAFLALAMAVRKLKLQKDIRKPLISDYLAAISAGIVEGTPLLDLCYEEDFAASVDMNVVATGSETLVEVQGSGEEATFSRGELDAILDLSMAGIRDIVAAQKEIIPKLP